MAVADRGLVSHAEAFRTRKAAEEGIANYLKENECYGGSGSMRAIRRWLREHDERLSVEIIEQAEDFGAEAHMAALRRIYDILYLDLGKDGEFYSQEKRWDSDTTAAIAEIVRPFFPKPPA